MQNNIAVIAANNFLALRKNSYPGRKIIVATDSTGKYAVIVYAIMGRSEPSRNRLFEADENGGLRTAQADPSKGGDLDLIIYKAMAEAGCCFAASNGKQTMDALKCCSVPAGMGAAYFKNWRYEPDAPNNTARISATVLLDGKGNFKTQFSLLKKSVFGEYCERQLFDYEYIAPGYGYGVNTYKCNGDPLPTFKGEPRLLPVDGDIQTVAQTYWDALDEDNKVSLAVKFIDLLTGESTMQVMNKYEAVQVS